MSIAVPVKSSPVLRNWKVPCVFCACVALTVGLGDPSHAQGLQPGDPRVATARSEFVDRMVAAHQFDRTELEQLLASAKIDESILESISRPAERVIPWYEYRGIFLNDSRINAGAQFWRDNEALVAHIAKQYDVAPEIVLAILGVESLFGQRMGSHRVLDALSTLTFAYPPRAAFFGRELEQFLLTARTEGPEHLQVLGSYAGAMGAGQFIPSSYEAYAVDGDGDGRRDLWTSWPDILSSIANYFSAHGWNGGEAVAVAAKLDQPIQIETSTGLELDETVASLRAAGLEFDASLADGMPAKLVALESGPTETGYWVGLHNFYVITRYNRSAKYALAVVELSEAIAAAYDMEVTDDDV